MKPALQLCCVVFVSTLAFGQNSTNDKLSLTSVSLSAAAPEVETPAPNTSGVYTAGSPSANTAAGSLAPQEANSATRKKVWYGLMAAEHSAAFFDAWSTRQVLSSGGGRELDPLVRPFSHSAAIYPALQVSPVAMDYLAARLMHSNNRIIRKLWWVPQAAGIAGSSLCGMTNLSNRR